MTSDRPGITRDDLKGMKPQEITAALKAGRLEHILTPAPANNQWIATANSEDITNALRDGRLNATLRGITTQEEK